MQRLMAHELAAKNAAGKNPASMRAWPRRLRPIGAHNAHNPWTAFFAVSASGVMGCLENCRSEEMFEYGRMPTPAGQGRD